MGNYKKTLLIGCGGSGIKTLIRLNELLSSNPNYRNDVRENISYLVIDTSKEDLDKFEAKINSQMGGTGLPNIATAHITERLSSLGELVIPNFEERDNEDLDKLKDHWMFSPDGEPFKGIHIHDLEQGAGQCCQVSYLATWNYMENLERILYNLVNNIRKRNPGADISMLNVYLIAGFAGGTGRGSWQLIAFKVRQFLREQGINVNIDAIFFDASCYPNVFETAGPEEADNLIVNSYTAMSELAAWLRCKSHKDNYYLELPYLNNPSSPVIKVTTDNSNDQSPVQRAFLIFGSNGVTGDLINNEEYHNMAATALYSLVVYPDEVLAVFSNHRMNIGSLGATTFEVDTYHLRSFFETAVQKKFIESQCAELTDSSLAEEVDKYIKEKYLVDNSLSLPDSISASDSGNSLEASNDEKELSLLQKIVKEKIVNHKIILSKKQVGSSEVKEFSTKKLREELGKQKDEAVEKFIEKELKLSTLNEDGLTTDLDEILKPIELDHDNLISTLDKTVLAQFAPEGKTVSLSRCIIFTDKLKSCFEQYIDVLKKGITVWGKSEACSSISDVIAILNGSKDSGDGVVDKMYKEGNGLLGLVGMGDKFQPKEVELICKHFQYCMYAAIFFKLQPVLTDFYQRAVDHLKVISEALNNMVEILEKTNDVLDKNFEFDFDKLTYDEIIKLYFIDANDSQAVSKSIPVEDDLKNVYYRQLKPIMSIKEINALLADPKNVRINRKPVMEEIGKQLQMLLDVHDSTKKNRRFDSSYDAKKVLPKELCKVITAHVHLEEAIGRDTFMGRYFSFEEVLKKNRQCWNNLLKESGSRDLEILKDRFSAFLGVDKEDYDEDNELPEIETLLRRIILSLVSTCKPWIQLVTSIKTQAEKLDCRILLPLPIDTTEVEKEINDYYEKSKLKMRAHINCPGTNDNAMNLPSDRIVVFNEESIEDSDLAPMDRIQNLTQWKKNAAVNASLVLAEAEKPCDGKLPWFVQDPDSGTWIEEQRGMAYVSPIFTNDPKLKRLRWHPWLKETSVTVDEEQRAKVHEALFYAFLGNGVEEASDLKRNLTNYNCEHPLSSMTKQDFNPNYNPRVWSDSEGKMIPSRKIPSWDRYISSKDALHSLDRVIEYLCGNGDRTYKNDPGSKNFQDSKELGKNLCEVINAEAEAFFNNVFQKLSSEDKKSLLYSLYTWLTTQQEASDKEDLQYWDALLEFAEKKCETLGVRIE